MERRAIVARIEGDFAFLKLSPDAAGCGRCKEVGGCGSGVLNSLFGSRCSLQKLPNPERAAVGEEVLLITPDGALWRAALVLYGLPIVLGLLGAMSLASQGDLASLAGFSAGVAAGLLGARVLVRGAFGSRFSPRIQRQAGASAGTHAHQAKIHWSKDMQS
ncbi:MAG: hypothetical protein RIR70_1914 [Pseudomonadota bacterium]|jgi:sigma-E factor negative regulatory protein RseC